MWTRSPVPEKSLGLFYAFTRFSYTPVLSADRSTSSLVCELDSDALFIPDCNLPPLPRIHASEMVVNMLLATGPAVGLKPSRTRFNSTGAQRSCRQPAPQCGPSV